MKLFARNKAILTAATAMILASTWTGVAHAQCALEAGGRNGTLQSTHFLWFGDDKKANAGSKFGYVKSNFSEQYVDGGWYGKTITAKPSANNRLYVYKGDGSHFWVEPGQTGTLDPKVIGVGCYASIKK